MDTAPQVRVGHLVAGTVGLSLIRHWYLDGAADDARLDELRDVLARMGAAGEAGGAVDPSGGAVPGDELSRALDPVARELDEGYAEWAGSYDGQNPFIAREEEVVRPVLDALAGPGVDALDAGCGTGRHAEHLARRGCSVIGVDQSEAMLAIARQKVPGGRFEVGDLRALPLADDCVDLVVVSLALSHLEDPTPALVELARVLRPGGHLVITDPHPSSQMLGGQAFFRGADGGLSWVRNHYHSASTWLRAFRAAGLVVQECLEPEYTPAQVQGNPTAALYPEAARTAFAGLATLWTWVLRPA